MLGTPRITKTRSWREVALEREIDMPTLAQPNVGTTSGVATALIDFGGGAVKPTG